MNLSLLASECRNGLIFTQDNERRVGPQQRLVTLHLVQPRVGRRDGAQGESPGEDVDRRPAGVTGEDGLLGPQPGHNEGARHIPGAAR